MCRVVGIDNSRNRIMYAESCWMTEEDEPRHKSSDFAGQHNRSRAGTVDESGKEALRAPQNTTRIIL